MQNKTIGLVNRSVFCGSIQEEALSFWKEIKKKKKGTKMMVEVKTVEKLCKYQPNNTWG